MQKSLLLFVSLFFSIVLLAQNKPNFNSLFNKGNRSLGIELGIAGEYPFGSVTAIEINKETKRLGALVIPGYSTFVQNRWAIGAYGIIGAMKSDYESSWDNSYNKNRYFDIGIAPFTRYYIPLGRRNVVSLFAQASAPIVYSTYKYEYKPGNNSGSSQIITTNEESLQLYGSLGPGIMVNGQFGSLELHANNTGLYLGFRKYLSPKKKD